MEDRPTLFKLIVLMVILTTIYILFVAPLFTAAYLAVTSDGNMKKWTDSLSKFLSFNSIKKLF